jgi:hypothetical protein
LSKGPKLLDAEAERREQEFGEVIASMEILRGYQPKTAKGRESLQRILDLIRTISNEAARERSGTA